MGKSWQESLIGILFGTISVLLLGLVAAGQSHVDGCIGSHVIIEVLDHAGVPVASASVRAFESPEGAEKNRVAAECETRADGTCTLCIIGNAMAFEAAKEGVGTSGVWVGERTLMPTGVDDVLPNAIESLPIDEASHHRRLALELLPQARITGKVLSASGTAMPRASVSFALPEPWKRQRRSGAYPRESIRVLADDNGEFVSWHDAPFIGSITAAADHEMSLPAFAHVAAHEETSVRLIIGSKYTLIGCTVDDRGSAIGGCLVTVVRDSRLPVEVLSDDAGVFKVAFPDEEDVYLFASLANLVQQAPRLVRAEDGHATAGLTLELARGVMLKGQVVDRNGESIEAHLTATFAELADTDDSSFAWFASRILAQTALSRSDGRFECGPFHPDARLWIYRGPNVVSRGIVASDGYAVITVRE